ncbi:unnamed protein product [Symbiodinium sp. CCMP2456]|nr:unnamed protein product [Symbiodinium sp. CCMP2456]
MLVQGPGSRRWSSLANAAESRRSEALKHPATVTHVLEHLSGLQQLAAAVAAAAGTAPTTTSADTTPTTFPNPAPATASSVPAPHRGRNGDFRTLPAPAWQRLYQDFVPISLPPTSTQFPTAKSAVGPAPDFAACDFRTLPARAWQLLYQGFVPISLPPTKLPAAKSAVGPAPDFAACDFRTLPAPAWQRLYQDFVPISLPPTSTEFPVAKNAAGPAPDFAACDFRTLPAPAWQLLYQDFVPITLSPSKLPQTESSTEAAVVAAQHAQPSQLPLGSQEESEESEEETEDEIDAHASPELGLRRTSRMEDPWRPALRWLCSVIDSRLKVPLPPAHARQVRGLLPLGGLDAEKLSVQDLSDGRLLCALVISVRPDVLPKANAVSLGRLAQFLKACAALGVNQVSLFTPPDLLPEPSNPPAVLRCLQARTGQGGTASVSM